jgi:hypothetical protein
MDLSSIATIVATILGSFGGLEFIKWLGSRKKNEVDWLEERMGQRDMKIDSMYVEIRNLETERLNWIHKYHELELMYKEAEWNRCNVRNCEKRQPPRRSIGSTINNDNESSPILLDQGSWCEIIADHISQ